MKTFFIIILVLFVIIVISLFAFLLTFDVNRYKDILVEKIEDAIDKDVRVGDMSLSFLPGLALRIDGLSIKDSDKTWDDSLLNATSINAGLRLLPLIKRNIDVQHLNIKELKINITKDFTPIIKPVFRDVELKGAIKEGDIVIRRLTGLASGGYFSIKGTIRNLFSHQYSEADIALKDINVAELLPEVPAASPQFEGRLSMNMHCSVKGIEPHKILDTLSAKGVAKIDKCVIKNINVLNVALDKLGSILPDLTERLKDRLPEHYRRLLEQNYTAFRPIQTDFNIKDGKIFFQSIRLESDAFYMIGSGYVSVEGNLAISSNLFIPRDLSYAFIDEVYELRYLQDSRGMITMPIDINGRIPDVSVKPDLDYVMRRLAVATGQELLKGVFRKERKEETKGDVEEKPETVEKTPGQDRKKEEPKPEEILIKSIFDIISGKER